MSEIKTKFNIDKEIPEKVCENCGKHYFIPTQPFPRKSPWKQGKLFFCSWECQKVLLSKVSSKVMRENNFKYSSKRNKKHNPMKKLVNRKKLSRILKEMGHKPPVHGGAGFPMPVPQRMLADKLHWPTEYILKTRDKEYTEKHLPTHYKIDIANPELKIAVEVDGTSHNSPKGRKRDRRKDRFLIACGWKVIRIKNEEVLQDLEECFQRVMGVVNVVKVANGFRQRGQ